MIILQQTRGVLSSGDQLALDLPFAETKSLTALIGPTPIFSRASGATYVGSDGLLHGVDTSTTSNTIGTGSKSFTLTATAGQDQFWRTGDAVEAANGTNSMVGTVTSYTPSTQVLVCNITSVTGSGTFTSWRIGYRGPRFDHGPVSPFACRGLLIEEGRTNLFQRSEEFSNTYWAPTRAPQPTANAAVSPDGATTADKLIADTTPSSNHRVDNASIPLALSTVYTLSIYAKASEYTGIALGVGVSLTRGVDYSLVGAGTATPVSGAGHTGTIQQLANGWYRCTATFTSDATTANHRVAIYVGQNGTTFAYTGDNTSGIFIWGAQLEAGSFPTSYIPTTTSALARSADVCSITGASFTSLWNATEGTMLINSFTPASGDRTVVAADDNTANEMILLRTEGTNPFFKVTDGGSELVAIDSGTVIANTVFKLAGAYKLNDFASSINGGVAVTDTTGTVPTVDRMRIGSGQGGNTMCGCVSSMRYYKKRLPNAKLQALTV